MTRNLNDVQIALLAARTLIADPGDWTKGALARDEFGREVFATSPAACQWCAEGALYLVTRDEEICRCRYR